MHYRFRQELIISAQGNGYLVKDPVRHTFARLGAAELLVAQYFDGASTLEQIQERLERERAVIAPVDKLERFQERLHGMQVILAPGEEVAPPDRDLGMTSGGWLDKLLFIRLPLEFNPDPMLTRLFQSTRFLFTPAFVAFTGALFLAAALIWFRDWSAIWSQVRELGSISGVLLLVLVFVVSVSIHELAHGLTTKAFGGQVPRMGAFLYYFLPAFYTDVSDAWLFPEKSKRALVIAAGAYATYILCFVTTILWWLVPGENAATQILVAFMVVNLLGATRTLFPLLKGDGYHLLSNALDLPNLREKSFEYLGARVKRVVGLEREPLPAAPPREARIYLVYGMATAAFSGAVLATVLYLVGRGLRSWL